MFPANRALSEGIVQNRVIIHCGFTNSGPRRNKTANQCQSVEISKPSNAPQGNEDSPIWTNRRSRSMIKAGGCWRDV